MLVSGALSKFSGSVYKKPIFIFSLVVLSVSLILSGLILGGGSSESPIVRNFYLVTFRYNPESKFFQNYEKVDKILDAPKDALDKVGDKLRKGSDNKDSKDEKNDQPSFHEIRVSYQGLCVDTSEGWDCAKSIEKLPEQDLSNDPASLVAIADLYKDKIVWSAPFWFTVISSGIAWILVLINCTPFWEMPLYTKTIATAMLIIASIANLGGMILGSVTSGSVAEIVKTVTFDAIEVHTGSMVVATGWASFALVTLALIGIGSVTAADLFIGRMTDIVTSKVESAFPASYPVSHDRDGPGATRATNIQSFAEKMAGDVSGKVGEKVGSYLGAGTLKGEKKKRFGFM